MMSLAGSANQRFYKLKSDQRLRVYGFAACSVERLGLSIARYPN